MLGATLDKCYTSCYNECVNTTKAPKATKCDYSGTEVTVSMGERLRGWTFCPSCGKEIKLLTTGKSVKTLPSHNRAR